MSPASTSPEDAVRRYLQWIEDPSSIVDDDAVAKAEAAVADAKDPLARLHARAALEHARRADDQAVIADFVTHAKAYADAQSIPVEAWRASGVDDDVLRRAGFGGSRGRRGEGGRRSGGGSRSRAPQVSVEEIKSAALSGPKRFTLAELSSAAGGGSPQTVRRAVEELIEAGQAENLGPKTDHEGRGRAPTLYALT